VVRIDVTQPPEIVAACDELLPDEERSGRPEHRVARAATRSLLARTLGVAPGTLSISRRCARCGDPEHGKPSVPGADIAFSLSHSGALGVLAIAEAPVAIGVDVEAARARAHLDRLAVRVLEPGALDAWQRATEAERLDHFLRAWTAKEAYLKATGEGIISAAAARPLDPEGWTISALAVPNGYVGALAVDHSPVRVTTEVWDPSVGMAELQAHPGPGARDLRD
jgi:phosphopantetheine--protein transferase-like protein